MAVTIIKMLGYLLSGVFSFLAFVEMASWKRTTLPSGVKRWAKEISSRMKWIRTPLGIALIFLLAILVGTELEFVIMVIAVSCVKLLSAHNSTQHTSRKHKV
jgi:hypothetical protein